MTNDQIAIPLVLGDEVPHFRLPGPSVLDDRPSAPATSLETERFGLLAGPTRRSTDIGESRIGSPAIWISNANPLRPRREAPGIGSLMAFPG
jgi:hypothetical protein